MNRTLYPTLETSGACTASAAGCVAMGSIGLESPISQPEIRWLNSPGQGRRILVIRQELRDNLPELWNRYLDSLARPGGPCTIQTIAAVRALWGSLQRTIGPSIRLPLLEPNTEGGVLLAWDSRGEHLEIEVYGDRSLHWFHRNRVSNQFDGTNDDRIAQVPEVLADHLKRIAVDR